MSTHWPPVVRMRAPRLAGATLFMALIVTALAELAIAALAGWMYGVAGR